MSLLRFFFGPSDLPSSRSDLLCPLLLGRLTEAFGGGSSDFSDGEREVPVSGSRCGLPGLLRRRSDHNRVIL